MATNEIKFEIIEPIANLGVNASGWTKELNLVSWNNARPKYDIRDWNDDHTRCGKGITLTEEEFILLKDALLNAEEDIE
jgi:hypothetical protein